MTFEEANRDLTNLYCWKDNMKAFNSFGLKFAECLCHRCERALKCKMVSEKGLSITYCHYFKEVKK